MSQYMHYRYICGILQKLLLVTFIILFGSQLLITRKQWVPSNTRNSSDSSSSFDQKNSSSKKSDAECAKYNFTTSYSNVTCTSLPIYDFFIFNNEFDILEIRLNELYDYVTLFLIAESRETLTGEEKPLYLKENWFKFSKYHDKIRRVEVKLVRNVTDAWPNEYRMRTEGLRLALSTITDPQYLIITSDVDEIPKARFMNALVNCPIPNSYLPMVLNCDFYYYSYEFRSKIHVHYGPAINLVNGNLSQLPPADKIRAQRFGYKFLPSTCFHCTWCFNQLKEVRSKMASYSHKEHNQIQFRTREHIFNRYRYGKDLFDRAGEEYIYIHNNTDYPQLVQSQPERFMFMMKRSKLSNVGFIDA